MKFTVKHTAALLTVAAISGILPHAAANPSKLLFTTQPTNTVAAATLPALVVQLADKNGVNVAQSNVSIVVTLNKSGLKGTATLNTDVQGKASFTNLQVVLPGSNLVFVASAPVAKYQSATSSVFSVSKATTITALKASSNSIVYGQSVTFTATVTPVAPASGTPTGTVTFKDGATTLGSIALSASGTAAFTTNKISAATASHTITAVYGGDTNFLTSTSSNVTETVSKLALTVSGIVASNKVYDATTTAGLNLASAKIATVLAGDNVTLITTAATGAFASKIVGTNKPVTVSGLALGGTSSNNYSLSLPTLAANISSRSLTITATGAAKIYDGTTAAAVTLANNRVAGDTLTISFTAATFASKNPGTNILITVTGLSITGPDAGNYTLTSTNATTATNIYSAQLTVAAPNLSRPYGATNPVFSASYTGFVAGESLSASDVTGSPVLSTTANTNSSVGVYPITISKGALASADYTFTFTNGTLTVTKAGTTAQVVTTLNPAKTNQSVTFSATVSTQPGVTLPLAGAVQFLNGTNLLGSPVTLSAGKASVTILAGTLGQANALITAAYSDPAGNFNASTNSLTQSVIMTVTPPPPSKLSLSSVPGSGARCQLAGVAGQTYVIQASADLMNWSSISTNVADTNGIVWLIDSNSIAAPERFYRAFSP